MHHVAAGAAAPAAPSPAAVRTRRALTSDRVPAQLNLAHELVEMMRSRGLQTRPSTWKELLQASGSCHVDGGMPKKDH